MHLSLNAYKDDLSEKESKDCLPLIKGQRRPLAFSREFVCGRFFLNKFFKTYYLE